jgi:hypothetical protein
MSNKTYGTVIAISTNSCRIAVKVFFGGISIMESYNPSCFEVNHEIYGSLEQEGGHFIYNKTLKAEYYAFIEATDFDLQTAKSCLVSPIISQKKER